MLDEKLKGTLAAQLVDVLSGASKRSRLGINYDYFIANKVQTGLTLDNIAYETSVTPFQTPEQHKLWNRGNIEEHLRVSMGTKHRWQLDRYIDQGYLPEDFGYSSTAQLQLAVESYFGSIGVPKFMEKRTPVMTAGSRR